AELLPVQLQERGLMEEGARRILLDETGPVAALEILGILGEGDPHGAHMLRTGRDHHDPPPPNPLEPDPAGVDVIVPLVATVNPSIACANPSAENEPDETYHGTIGA